MAIQVKTFNSKRLPFNVVVKIESRYHFNYTEKCFKNKNLKGLFFRGYSRMYGNGMDTGCYYIDYHFSNKNTAMLIKLVYG